MLPQTLIAGDHTKSNRRGQPNWWGVTKVDGKALTLGGQALQSWVVNKSTRRDPAAEISLDVADLIVETRPNEVDGESTLKGRFSLPTPP